MAAEFDRRPEIDLLIDSFVKIQPSGARVTRKNPVISDRETFRKALFQRQLWKATPSITGEARGGPAHIIRRDPPPPAGLRLPDPRVRVRQLRRRRTRCCGSNIGTRARSPAQDNMIPANIELVRRHPEYLSVRAYRPGLAYILRLSLWRRLKKGNLRGAARDVGKWRRGLRRGEAARFFSRRVSPAASSDSRKPDRGCGESGECVHPSGVVRLQALAISAAAATPDLVRSVVTLLRGLQSR